jgi:hypothetical protein
MEPVMSTNVNEIIELNPANQLPAPVTARVHNLLAKIKKITTTDESKLQVVLETEGMDDDAILQVKAMLVLQQTALVKVAMDPVQQDLFDA